MSRNLRVLLIEDSPAAAHLIQEILAETRLCGFEVEHVDRLSTGLARLENDGIDVVLLDLSLPDSQGLDTFASVLAMASEVPVVVLTGNEDDDLALQAMRAGAQDFLAKGSVDGPSLARALRYAVERSRYEEDLRVLNETVQALVEASPLAMVALDTESRVILWSPAAQRTFGWTEQEVLGQRIPIVPDESWDEHLAFRQRVLAGERFTGVEVRRRDKAGAAIDLRVSAGPLRDARGNIQGVALFLEDVSDRKRTERAIRRLASVPEQSPAPLIELDLAGNAVYLNHAARSRFPDLEALGSWHPVLASVASVLPRFQHGETRSFSFEVSHGQSVYHQMVYYVPDSTLVRVFLTDVTEQRRAREILGDLPLPGLPSNNLQST